MVINKLVLHNFGVYASTNTFSFSGQKPIVLIGGLNGRGKTTFLEAILLALYGSNSFAYAESKYDTYGKYLKAYTNKADGSLKSYVKLSFSIDSENKEEYSILRSWDSTKKRVSEEIYVKKNGHYDHFLTENWGMFIESVLPSGLANFFFFDGEKIAELAVDSTSAQMKESIRALLGISTIDKLSNDLRRVINKATSSSGDSDYQELENRRIAKEAISSEIQNVENKTTTLQNTLTELTQKLEALHNDYSAKGGDVIEQKTELFQRRADFKSQMSVVKEQLIFDAGGDLPLVLVSKLLSTIKQKAEQEELSRQTKLVVDLVEKYYSEYPFQTIESYTEINKFISFVQDQAGEASKKAFFNLSPSALYQLHDLLGKKLKDTQALTHQRQSELDKLSEGLLQVENYLSIDIDEQSLSSIYKDIRETELKISETEAQINALVEHRKTLNGNYSTAQYEYTHLVEQYLLQKETFDDNERVLKYAHYATSILEEYAVRLQKEKVHIVAETMTDCYHRLANKKNLINTITMDPYSLDLSYFDYNNHEINKASLSAGEKQLMVVALLWSLALCSKQKLPVIIDTPLSRLDSEHRASLVKTYFPQASDQTIILSTDSEITPEFYEMMEPEIGDEYTLVFNDSTQATTIQTGFFRDKIS